MSLRLNGSTSGYVEIDAPAVAGTTSITIPATTGGQFVVTDASGNVNLDSGTLYVDAVNNRVGVGTTSPQYRTHIHNSTASADTGLSLTTNTTGSTNTDGFQIIVDGNDSSVNFIQRESSTVNFSVNGSDALRIDSSRRLLLGTSSWSAGARSVVAGNSSVPTGNGVLAISRGTNTAMTSGDPVANIEFTNSSAAVFARISVEADGTTGTTTDLPGRLMFWTTADGASSPTEAMRIGNNGQFYSVPTYNSTTTNAANVFIASNGNFARSTSSIKYKTDVETLQDSYADAILNCRPVWYRSTTGNDNPEWGWWGFIAEEVADIDPRLVFWKTTETSHNDKGLVVETPLESPAPEGVQYDRFVPHLLNLIKRQKEQIEALETRLTALEGGTAQ